MAQRRKNLMARQSTLKKTKAPKKTVSRTSIKMMEEKGFGAQPLVKNYNEAGTFAYTKDLSWFSRFIEMDQGLEHLATLLKKQGYSTKQIQSAKRKCNSTTVCSIALMQELGYTLQPVSLEWFKNKIQFFIDSDKNSTETTTVNSSVNVINIAERTENKAKAFTADIDDVIDSIWLGNTKLEDLKMFELFENLQIKPAHIRVLEPYYKKQLDDTVNNLEADLSEIDGRAAKAKHKKQAQESITIYNKILEAFKTWGQSKTVKKERKPSAKTLAKKAITIAAKQNAAVSALQYAVNDDKSGLVSVKPQSIPGAQNLITFNHKYNVLTYYVAANDKGLGLRGSTILNFDADKSVSKRAGRALDQIKMLASQTNSKAMKNFQTIKGTELPVRARISEDTILVRSSK